MVKLVESGDLLPSRAIDLGCGEGDNAIFLAQHGFKVTAVDFSPEAIAKAKAKTQQAGAEVDFVIDDITRLAGVSGHFDVLVDYGTFGDLSNKDRAAYVDKARSLAKPGAKFLLWCFERELKGWERLATAILPPGTSRCDQVRSSSGSRAPSTSRGSPARAVSESGRVVGRRTS
jgi:cyclopropane fatty-acyl-phospholipid synthase-like methyltransferase